MPRRQPASKPSWTDVFDRLGLLGLIQDLYTAHKDNQTFLHARLGLGADILKPYKETLDRWLWPDVLRNQDTSVAKASEALREPKGGAMDRPNLRNHGASPRPYRGPRERIRPTCPAS